MKSWGVRGGAGGMDEEFGGLGVGGGAGGVN